MRTDTDPARNQPRNGVGRQRRPSAASSAQARVQARLQALTEERIQARLLAAGEAWNHSRPALLVRQYRGSEFHDRTKRAVAVRFRIPVATDPAPGQRRMVLVSVWAGVLGFAGVIAAMPLLANLFLADGGWYRPVMTLIGLIGVGATAGAFASIHRRRAPWIMLSAGTAALLAAVLVNMIH